MGITDIDDKLLKRAKELSAAGDSNMSVDLLARKYESSFFADMKSLKVNFLVR